MKTLSLLLLLFVSSFARAADLLIRDTFMPTAALNIDGRSPTTNLLNATWKVAPFNLGGGFNATVSKDAAHPSALLTCAGNSSGAILLHLDSPQKPRGITLSATLAGNSPALGFYSTLPAQDPDGVHDIFFHFTGLELLPDGSLLLYQNGAESNRIKFAGSFTPESPHTLRYDIDTATGALSNVTLSESTADYSPFTQSTAFTSQATAYAAAAALCDGGRDNAATIADFQLLAHPVTPITPPPLQSDPVPAASPILIHNGQTIGFLGDSITALGSGSDGYVGLTIAGLKLAGISATAIPAGHSGDTSGNMLYRLNPQVLRKGANWMTLSCGVNDVHMQSNHMGVELDAYQKNVATIVKRAQGWNVQIILLTATPLGEDLSNANNQKLAGYNDFLRTFAAENHLPLCDINAAFQKVLNSPSTTPFPPGKRLLADGIHPNPAGQFLMAITLLKTLGIPASQLPQIETTLKENLKHQN